MVVSVAAHCLSFYFTSIASGGTSDGILYSLALCRCIFFFKSLKIESHFICLWQKARKLRQPFRLRLFIMRLSKWSAGQELLITYFIIHCWVYEKYFWKLPLGKGLTGNEVFIVSSFFQSHKHFYNAFCFCWAVWWLTCRSIWGCE